MALVHSPALRFERIAWESVDWDGFNGYDDRSLFQSRAWLAFLEEVQGGEPVAAVLTDGQAELGRFHGLLIRRWGMKFLGSPLPGWTTPYMGFAVKPGVARADAARALLDFAFKELGCLHLELRDRRLTEDDVVGLGFDRRADVGYDDRTFEVDLAADVQTIFGRMESACRRNIRQAEKRGLTIEEVAESAFADEFYEQLTQVFVLQGLVPTYGVERVRALIRHLRPAGQLLLLRARDAEGRGIATGIYPAFGQLAFFWGGASLKEFQSNRPNESLHWYAMRYWKARGATVYDMGGFMEYKRKYGGTEVSIPGFRRSRSPLISTARSLAPNAMRVRQTVIGRIQRNRLPAPALAASRGE